MSTHHWQKSSFSGEAANCLYVAEAPDGTIMLRESDQPEVIITTTREHLSAFILGVQAGEFDRFMRQS